MEDSIETVNCSIGAADGETLGSAKDFPVYSFHYLELRFRENPQFGTIKKNWKTEGGVKSVGCDGVEATEPRSNSIQCKEGAPGCRASFICPVDGRV